MRGLKTGESKTFQLKFPEDYHGKDVAGKTAVFRGHAKRVEGQLQPELNEEFAKSLGVADGDGRRCVWTSGERGARSEEAHRRAHEVRRCRRCSTPRTLELPKALVQMERERMVEQAAAELRRAASSSERLPIDPQAFEATATRRVALA